jgi:hypothetical protein
MAGFYDSAKFGMINRKWFGLTKKHGGDCAAGYTFGTCDATAITHLARWYPMGPIDILKFGAKVLASIVAGSQDTTDRIDARLVGRGGSASTMATFTFDIDGGTIIQHVFASDESMVVSQVKAGEYVSITTGTPRTSASASAANTATTLGTVAFFVDWAPKFDIGGRWDRKN